MKASNGFVYWTKFSHYRWDLYLAATDDGLCCITLPNEDIGILQRWVQKHIPGAELLDNENKMHPYKQQLEEYFHGRRQEFTCRLDLRGTSFQVRVWHALTQIPFGEVKTYSQIAGLVGNPRAVRAVGAANGINPIPIVVPCHRVIGKDGGLTGYRGGIDMKAELLALEGFKNVYSANRL